MPWHAVIANSSPLLPRVMVTGDRSWFELRASAQETMVRLAVARFSVLLLGQQGDV